MHYALAVYKAAHCLQCVPVKLFCLANTTQINLIQPQNIYIKMFKFVSTLYLVDSFVKSEFFLTSDGLFFYF